MDIANMTDNWTPNRRARQPMRRGNSVPHHALDQSAV
jgi:hypothetical protein